MENTYTDSTEAQKGFKAHTVCKTWIWGHVLLGVCRGGRWNQERGQGLNQSMTNMNEVNYQTDSDTDRLSAYKILRAVEGDTGFLFLTLGLGR